MCLCFPGFLWGIYSFAHEYLDHFYIVGFRVFLCLCFSFAGVFRTCCSRRPGSSEDTVPWLLVIIFLGRCLGIWVWDNYRPRCWFLSMSLLGGCFAPWLLFTLWMYGECDALAFLFHWPALLVLGAGIQWLVEGGTLGKDGLWDSQKNFPGWKGGCSWCSVAVLEMRQGFHLGKQRAEKVCWQPTWFSGRCGLRQECPLLTGSFSFLLFIYLFVYLTLFLFYTLCLYILYKIFKDFHCNFEFKRILLERINAKIDSKALYLNTNP